MTNGSKFCTKIFDVFLNFFKKCNKKLNFHTVEKSPSQINDNN